MIQPRRRSAAAALLGSAGTALAGCEGLQSSLSPIGLEADRVHTLFWILTGSGAAILAFVVVLAALAGFGARRWRAWMAHDRFVLLGGLVFPIVVLSALLAYGLVLMGAVGAGTQEPGRPSITVVGERWWWRVIYAGPEGQRIESANELRIPAGQPVRIALRTADVIHSFWVPRLAGKLDMIPGRTNVLTLTAIEPGISRGQCAEYCGGAHAFMSFYVVAMEEPQFASWLAGEMEPARAPREPAEIAGRDLFLKAGCGACHTIRGTPATGSIGPDLTHVGSRMTLGAATLANDAAAFARWIRDNQHVKPDNLMPPYRIFGDDELAAVAAYLESLK